HAIRKILHQKNIWRQHGLEAIHLIYDWHCILFAYGALILNVSTNATISFQFAGLPGGAEYCFTSPDRFALDIAAGLSGFLPGNFNKIINSDSEPSAAD